MGRTVCGLNSMSTELPRLIPSRALGSHLENVFLCASCYSMHKWDRTEFGEF